MTPARSPGETAAALREAARAIGFDLVGTGPLHGPEDGGRLLRWVASGRAGEMAYMTANPDRRADPRRTLTDARGVVAVGLHHDPGDRPPDPGTAAPAPEGPPRGFIARYARGRDYHRVMETALRRLKAEVLRIGGPGTTAHWTVDHGPVLDRALAAGAGLGFVGKSTALIHPRAGSYFLLGEVLTNLELPPEESPAGGCGTCSRCIDLCPTAAITAPYEVDARRCISYLTIELRGPIPEEFRPAVGSMVFGCDICQEVCPWNRFARPVSAADLRPRAVAVEPDLLRLAAMDEAEWKSAFQGMAILRAGYGAFRRNVAVALGNAGGAAAEAALEALARCGDPLVEEHARWGLGRLAAEGRPGPGEHQSA